MKILIITNNIKLDSGIGRYSFSIVEQLENLGIKHTVITEKCKNWATKKEKSILLPKTSVLNIIKNLILIRRELKSYDVVHALDCWPYGVYAYVATLGTKKRIFINGVGTYSVPSGNKIKTFFMKRAYTRAVKVFCISNYVKKRIIGIVPHINVDVVFLGTTKLPSLSVGEKNFYKNKYNFNNHHPILLTVGGIKNRKGQLDTVKAVYKLKKQYPNVLYLIVGSDRDKGYVGKILNYVKVNNLGSNVKILPNIQSDIELTYLYSLCDVFLLNSNNEGIHFEGFGLVLLEAAQLKKPVIGSVGCGIEDAMENGYNGYLVKQRDSEDVYQKLLLVLGEKYTFFAENSLEFSKRFAWEKTVSSYVKYY